MADMEETVGQRLQRLREERGLSQEDIGERTGLGLRIIARIEAGTPPGDFLIPIAEDLGVTAEYLRTGYEETQDEVVKFVEAELRTRLGSTMLVQECLEEFVSTVRFRGENLSDTDFEVLQEKLDEYLSWRETEDEDRAFSLGGHNDPR